MRIVTVRLSKDQRNQVIGVLTATSMVNDIANHFGCSRQTIHDLMNQYNELGLSEFVQDLVVHVWQRYVLIALTRQFTHVIV